MKKLIQIGGKVKGCVEYSIWNDKLQQSESNPIQKNKIPIPEESGIYLIQLDITWLSEGENYSIGNYFLKLKVE